MTKAQAAILQARWALQGDPPVCVHPALELAQSEREAVS